MGAAKMWTVWGVGGLRTGLKTSDLGRVCKQPAAGEAEGVGWGAVVICEGETVREDKSSARFVADKKR